jgi:ribosome biogenesis GTPase
MDLSDFLVNSDSRNPYMGTVIKKLTNAYHVQSDLPDAGERICTLSQRLKRASEGDPITIGDRVCWNEAAQITSVLPRRNRVSRRSAVPMPSAHAHEHIIAANVDQVVAVIAAAHPRLSWRLLDRYLVSAESAHIPALICLTKIDLVEGAASDTPEGAPLGAEITAVAAEYAALGYGMILSSTLTGQGIAELKAALHGRVSVLIGKSGAGKTSLLNAIQPGLGLRVQATNERTGKGRHTTTHLEMFCFEPDSGSAIIDTPGMREFGLWDVDGADLASCFPEMRPLLGMCRFGLSCLHNEEPGCTIRRAVMDGRISPYRYQSYLKLRAEL